MVTELIVWGSIFVFMVIVESMTTQIVSVWFAVGSAAAFICSLLSLPLVAQISVFIVVSVILLVATRPIFKKVKTTPKPTNADAVVGQTGTVTEEINNVENQGRIKAEGLSWNARTVRGKPISVGSVVRVIRLEGVTAYVEPMEEKELIIK